MTQPDPGQSDPGLPARLAALDLISTALARRGGLDEALSHPAFAKLPPQDRGFARALAMATLRRLGGIDRALDGRMQKPPPQAVRELLRIGVAQLWALDVPDFAAVSTTVKLAERDGSTRPFKGLINAVLRGVARDGAPGIAADAWLPSWIFARWAAAFGEETARAVAATVPQEPPTDLTLRDPAEAERWAQALEAEVLPGGSLRVRRKGDLAEWPGFAEGAWWVQDAAAAVPARLLDVKPVQTALDLCAAPGGKTLQLAAAGAEVVALDRSPNRLKRLNENFARIGLKVEALAADAEAWEDARTFDAVLLDAPCTSTGTFRRNPDVLWGTKPADIAKLADVQHRLLDAAAERVKPGGRLVYCVCSLEREEGEAQIIAFLRRRPDFTTEPCAPGEAGAPEDAVTREGWLRILPSEWPDRGGLDGFFAARLVRKG
ncbi:RsmB/NOP family class I SAM-dependent RNA methyltransferase [Caulobacter sp. 17J80-11]|uniref:RsmB/NOP family class I SAM-dependent RNA methyltransferase n=1 Tax=Caulobacter sp. 17J80-11 TaxID=2763502 RepID=UPI0016538BA1|nr:RsmB/NOP family class I SAM-dependent RNA methyltransferase [Caulobacter sp. 17J80-11]MBC6983556.1 RsmB/NOP family class I SAM-dependent RNA methyltransferase [Caulobacter sp. 17J80-11]